jgi:hypothetical protein
MPAVCGTGGVWSARVAIIVASGGPQAVLSAKAVRHSYRLHAGCGSVKAALSPVSVDRAAMLRA